MKEYRKIVGDALSDAVGIEIEEGQYGLDLIEHGLVDSLAMMNIIMHMEKNLGQRIDSKNFTNDDFRSFNSIRSLIEKL